MREPIRRERSMPSFLKALSVVLCLGVLLALPAAPTHAQAHAGGTIQGTVTDESGAVLPAVSVSIRNVKTGVVRETLSDSLGLFRAPLLPVGLYEISPALQGFATLKRGNIELNIGQVIDLTLPLKVAAAEETVTVEAETPLIETDRSQ